MANPEEFRRRIESSISQDYKVEFLGKNFDQIVSLLTETKAKKICQKLAPTTGLRGLRCSLLSISKYHRATSEYTGGI